MNGNGVRIKKLKRIDDKMKGLEDRFPEQISSLIEQSLNHG